MKFRFSSLFNKSSAPEKAVYPVIVAKARQEFLYRDCGVSDTPAGRTDALMLHAFLVFDRLYEQSPQADEFSAKLFSEMYKDLEYGFQTLGVPSKKIKSVADVFNAVCDVYRGAFVQKAADRQLAIRKALVTNGLAATENSPETDRLVDYVDRARDAVFQEKVDAIIAGQLKMDVRAGDE